MARKLGVDEVLQRLFDDDFGLSEDDSSDEDGEGIFAYAGEQHFDAAEAAALSSGVAFNPGSVPEGNAEASASK